MLFKGKPVSEKSQADLHKNLVLLDLLGMRIYLS